MVRFATLPNCGILVSVHIGRCAILPHFGILVGIHMGYWANWGIPVTVHMYYCGILVGVHRITLAAIKGRNEYGTLRR